MASARMKAQPAEEGEPSRRRYRLNADTIGLSFVSGRHTAVQIPKGTVVELRAASSTDSRLIGVSWADGTADVFAQDIWDRGEEIER